MWFFFPRVQHSNLKTYEYFLPSAQRHPAHSAQDVHPHVQRVPWYCWDEILYCCTKSTNTKYRRHRRTGRRQTSTTVRFIRSTITPNMHQPRAKWRLEQVNITNPSIWPWIRLRLACSSVIPRRDIKSCYHTYHAYRGSFVRSVSPACGMPVVYAWCDDKKGREGTSNLRQYTTPIPVYFEVCVYEVARQAVYTRDLPGII